MSSIVTDRGLVHYETYGRGRPVVLLHGWLESWVPWMGTMEALGRRHKTYALDFWGFGESAKQGAFTIDEYVEMVSQFMERMGLRFAHVMGHSMGGTVTLALMTDQMTATVPLSSTARSKVLVVRKSGRSASRTGVLHEAPWLDERLT